MRPTNIALFDLYWRPTPHASWETVECAFPEDIAKASGSKLVQEQGGEYKIEARDADFDAALDELAEHPERFDTLAGGMGLS